MKNHLTAQAERPPARLKHLPPERQAEIMAYSAEHGTAATVQWLAAEGCDTSGQGLEEFFAWYQLVKQFRAVQQDQETFLELIQSEPSGLTPAQLETLGIAYFTAQAIKANEPKLFVTLASARQEAQFKAAELELKRQDAARKDRELELMRDKFEFDAAKACLNQLAELRAIATNPKMRPTEKIQQIRQQLFGSLPPLLPAGAETNTTTLPSPASPVLS